MSIMDEVYLTEDSVSIWKNRNWNLRIERALRDHLTHSLLLWMRKLEPREGKCFVQSSFSWSTKMRIHIKHADIKFYMLKKKKKKTCFLQTSCFPEKYQGCPIKGLLLP